MTKKNKSKAFEKGIKEMDIVNECLPPSSSEKDDPVLLIGTDDEDRGDEKCLFCSKTYKNDKGSEQWIRCISC